MNVTAAFLAEAAWIVDNKLNVQGGVVSRFAVGPERSARFVLVVLTESETGNSDHRVEVEVRSPEEEEPEYIRLEVPEGAIGQFPGFAFFDIELNLPVDGRWVLVVTGGAGVVSLPVLVSSQTPPPN